MYTRPKYNVMQSMIEYLEEEGFCRQFEKDPQGFLDKQTGKVIPKEEVKVCRSLYFSSENGLGSRKVIHAIRTQDGIRGWWISNDTSVQVRGRESYLTL